MGNINEYIVKCPKCASKVLIWIFLVTAGIISTGSSYLLDNVNIVPRKSRWANEARRTYVPKPAEDDISIYKPSKKTEREKKLQIAEEYVIKMFPKEFKLDKVIRKDEQWSWLKRPLSYKSNKKKIILHHTAASYSWLDSIQKEIAVVQDIYRFHTFSRERGDIGYNYLIGPSWTIFEGRYGWAKVVAAHATRNNTDSVGISLLGNFDIEQPSKEQIASLIKLLVALWHTFEINPMDDVSYHKFDEKLNSPYIRNIKMDSIVGHTDVGATSCPWENLYKLIPTIKRAVAKQLGYVGTSINPNPSKEVQTVTIKPSIKRKTQIKKN